MNTVFVMATIDDNRVKTNFYSDGRKISIWGNHTGGWRQQTTAEYLKMIKFIKKEQKTGDL